MAVLFVLNKLLKKPRGEGGCVSCNEGGVVVSCISVSTIGGSGSCSGVNLIDDDDDDVRCDGDRVALGDSDLPLDEDLDRDAAALDLDGDLSRGGDLDGGSSAAALFLDEDLDRDAADVLGDAF